MWGDKLDSIAVLPTMYDKSGTKLERVKIGAFGRGGWVSPAQSYCLLRLTT